MCSSINEMVDLPWHLTCFWKCQILTVFVFPLPRFLLDFVTNVKLTIQRAMLQWRGWRNVSGKTEHLFKGIHSFFFSVNERQGDRPHLATLVQHGFHLFRITQMTWLHHSLLPPCLSSPYSSSVSQGEISSPIPKVYHKAVWWKATWQPLSSPIA